MIEAENITKRFGSLEAVKGISFSVEKGEVVGLLGPNGAGKTTTMRILTCFTPPSSGTARVGDLDVARDSLQVRRMIGYSLERASMYPEMRVLAFLRFAGEAKGMGRSEVKRAVPEVLELCGLEKVKDRINNNLSKGYRQRLVLAQALINSPKVLILDEPTIGLDPESVNEIRNLIKNLTGERTVILSSHILAEVSMICNKVMIMNEGRIVAADTTANLRMIFQDMPSVDVEIEASSCDVSEELKRITGVIRVETGSIISERVSKYRLELEKGLDIYPALNAIARDKQWIFREIHAVDMSLEEIFLKVISKKQLN